eukprot:m.39505 g.39505  ORF g.39505 m.39505 type:complete len:728 (+) comp11279_c0_seq2:1222-3405(+)
MAKTLLGLLVFWLLMFCVCGQSKKQKTPTTGVTMAMAALHNLLFGLAVLLCLAVVSPTPRPSLPTLIGEDSPPWWVTGVVYQIYPRSFQDGCTFKDGCTGTGSLAGIADRIDYLAALGVTTLWLSPIFASPQVDFGYDISNYTDIWPTFGTMEDFDRLLGKIKAAGLRLLLDLVPNHTSDQHPWFLESKSSLTNPKRDWYIWRNGSALQHHGETTERLPPNNWRTMFCLDPSCSAWTYDNTTDQWFYHVFYRQQPDLNWRNPEVVEAMHNVMRFWLDKGVDGFRVDAFPNMLEDPQLTNEPIDPAWHGDPVRDGYGKLLHTHTENVQGLHELVRGMRGVLDEYGSDRIMIGEIYADKVVTEKDVISYYGTEKQPEFTMPFNMMLIAFFGGSFDPAAKTTIHNGTALRMQIDHYYQSLPIWAQANFVVGNHDVRRIRTRLGDELMTRVCLTLLLTLQGTPTIYNADEIAQADGYVPPGKRQDPNCKKAYDGVRCRDPQRTPMQWNASMPNAGFTGATTVPWLPVSQDAVHTNVAAQLADGSSTLRLVQNLLHLRRYSEPIAWGSYESIESPVANPPERAEALYMYVRAVPGKNRLLVVHNLGKESAVVNCMHFDSGVETGMPTTDTVGSGTTLKGTVVLDSQRPSVVALPLEDLRRVPMLPTQSLIIELHDKPQPSGGVGGKKNTVQLIAIAGSAGGAFLLVLVAAVVIYRKRNRGHGFEQLIDINNQ